MNGHRSSSNNSDDLLLPLTIHTRSHQLPFDSCWNVRVLHNLPPYTNHITNAILNLSTNSFCPLDTALVLTSDNLLLDLPPSIPLATPWWHLSKTLQWRHLVVCSHTFTLFWLRKTSVTVEIFQLSIRVFTCAFPAEIPVLSLILCYKKGKLRDNFYRSEGLECAIVNTIYSVMRYFCYLHYQCSWGMICILHWIM